MYTIELERLNSCFKQHLQDHPEEWVRAMAICLVHSGNEPDMKQAAQIARTTVKRMADSQALLMNYAWDLYDEVPHAGFAVRFRDQFISLTGAVDGDTLIIEFPNHPGLVEAYENAIKSGNILQKLPSE